MFSLLMLAWLVPAAWTNQLEFSNEAATEMSAATALDPRVLSAALKERRPEAVRSVLSYRIRRGTNELFEQLANTSMAVKTGCVGANSMAREACGRQLRAIEQEAQIFRRIASSAVDSKNLNEHLRLATAVYFHHILSDLLIPRSQQLDRDCHQANQMRLKGACGQEVARIQAIRDALSNLKEISK